MTRILCIGSVLWDIIGRADQAMRQGSDMPGQITRLPGGVAMNIAMTLTRFGLRPTLLSAMGMDAEGDELMRACADMGLETAHIHRDPTRPTDRYMAVEGVNGLIAAIADAYTLEAAGRQIIAPLEHGPLGSNEAPYQGAIALDGNLTTDLLAHIAASPAFARADLRIAPASPGKAERLLPFLAYGRGTLYVNLEEASILCQRDLGTTEDAAKALLDRGAWRVLVTDGDRLATEADAKGKVTMKPPEVLVTRVTGAGDTFMAAHIAAESAGIEREAALSRALNAAARYVSGGTPL